MNLKERRDWRTRNLKLVYFGNNPHEMLRSSDDFWRSADISAKHQAMKEFVQDELERTGMTEYGPKLLRLTSTFRPA
jgi:hypothetical protein